MRRAVVRLTLVPALALVLGGVTACDDRSAFHEPDPTWARMLDQKRADPFATSTVFLDGKTMRRPPDGTVARDDDRDDPPPPVTRALLEHGRGSFETICATCHGVAGDGKSVVATKMSLRPPPSLHEDRFRALSRDQLFTIASDGYGLMPGYAGVLSREDRWAVASYVQALQLARGARVASLPPDVRAELEKEAP